MPEGATASLGEIVGDLGGELIGDPAARIESLAPIDSAGPGQLSFVANPAYVKRLASSQAACVIVAPAERELATRRGPAIVTADPYLYYARLSRWWAARSPPRAPVGVDPRAAVDPSATIAADASVGAFAVIEAEVVVEAGAKIGAHAFIGAGSRVGNGTRLAPQVSLMAGTTLGANCIVHAGAVLGADGFGFAPSAAGWEKIEQLGHVVVGDDVEIGANTCIDRGALGDTVIGDGVKIDNLVQIGHNVKIGEHTAIAGCVGIAGSTTIGKRCMIGGGAGVIGHVTIADGTIITAATQVTRSIPSPGTYSGMFPFDDNAAWEKNAATLRNLHKLRERVKALEKKP